MDDEKRKIETQLGRLLASVDREKVAFIAGYLFCWHEIAGSEQFDEHFADPDDREETIDHIYESYVDGYLKMTTPGKDDLD